jgi:putative membrane protein
MFSCLLTWVVTALSLLVADYFMPGLKIEGLQAALGAAVILGLVNTLVRPLLVLLTLPLTILSLGLFILVINGVTFALVDYFTPGLRVDNFFDAILASLFVSLVSWGINFILGND